MKKINDKLAIDIAALNELPQHSGSVAEALATFMRICSLATESLKKIFLKVGFDECTEDFEMQCAAKWSELLKLELKQYSAQLCSEYSDEVEYLMDELVFLLEAQKSGLVLSAKEIQLSNLRPCAVYLDVLQKRVSDISATTTEFVGKLWNYIEGVVIKVLMHNAGTYPELQYFIKSAVQNLIARRKDELVDWVGETIGTDRLTDITSNPEYVATYRRLVVQKKQVWKFCQYHRRGTKMNKGYGEIDVLYLRQHPKDVVQQAFELKMLFNPLIVDDQLASLQLRFAAYRKFAFGLEKFVNEIKDEVLGDLIASHAESSLQETLVAKKCSRLKKSVTLLEESKEMVAKINGQSCSSC